MKRKEEMLELINDFDFEKKVMGGLVTGICYMPESEEVSQEQKSGVYTEWDRILEMMEKIKEMAMVTIKNTPMKTAGMLSTGA